MNGVHPGSWLLGGGMMMWMIWLIPIIAAFVILLSLFGGGSKPDQDDQSELEGLEQAHARGELSREEFLRKRDEFLHERGH